MTKKIRIADLPEFDNIAFETGHALQHTLPEPAEEIIPPWGGRKRTL